MDAVDKGEKQAGLLVKLDKVARIAVLLFIVAGAARLWFGVVVDELLSAFFIGLGMYVLIPLSGSVFGAVAVFMAVFGIGWIVFGAAKLQALLDQERVMKAVMWFSAIAGTASVFYVYFFTAHGISSMP